MRTLSWGRTALLLAALSIFVAACGQSSAQSPAAPAASATAAATTVASQSAAAPAQPAPVLRADAHGDVTASVPPMSPLPAAGNMPAGTYMREIQERGRLIVGVSQDTLLFGYLDPTTSQLEGFDIDVARAVAKAIFGDENRIQFVAVTSAGRIAALNERRVDMIASTFTINAARKEQIEFSEVYYEAGQKVLVRKDSQSSSIGDLDGQRVCAPRGSTSAKNIGQANPQAVLVETDTFTDCLVLFQLGRVDAISTDDVILSGLAAQDPYAKVVGDKFTAEPYGLGISKDHQEFVAFVNGVLSKMKSDGTWKKIYSQWLGRFGDTPEPPRGTYYRP